MIDNFQNLLKGTSRQILMGIAILWVMIFHLGLYGNLFRFEPINFLASKGYLGVDVFFFLSSYGLCFSYQKNNLLTFYKRRFLRLFPIYPIFLIILILAFGYSFKYSGWEVFLLQITGLSNFASLEIEWYIPSLILLYLFFPIVYKTLDYLYKKNIAFILLLLFVLVALYPILSKGIFYLFVMRLPIIVVGITSYIILKHKKESDLWVLMIFSALLSFCFAGKNLLSGSQTGPLALPLILLGIAQVSSKISFDNWVWKSLAFCGKHSLEIYLAQNLVFNHFFVQSNIQFVVKTSVGIVVIVVLSLVLGVVQHFCQFENTSQVS